MNKFRTEQTIVRKTEGKYVDGIWQEGTEQNKTIMASVQPATSGDYDTMLATEGGETIERSVRIYTDERLVVAGENDEDGDILKWEGEQYRITQISPWRTTRLKHYRYLAVKLHNED